MMIKAKITIFDDETGQVFEKDKVIEPCREEVTIGPTQYAYNVEECEFRFDFRRFL